MTQELARAEAQTVVAEAAPTETGAVFSIIERAARDPNVDIEKLERLMAMQERMTARAAEGAFNAAMQAAQAEMPQVTRDARNDQTRSRYARLETISAAIKPVVTQHGFSLSYGTDHSPLADHYGVTCLVAHSGGFSRLYRADIPTDANGMKGNQNKTATHAFGSTMSYGRRYLLLMVFDIALTNEDDDGQAAGRRQGDRGAPASGGGEVVTDDQAATLRDALTGAGGDIDRFVRFFRIECLPDLPAARFDEAMRMIAAKGNRR